MGTTSVLEEAGAVVDDEEATRQLESVIGISHEIAKNLVQNHSIKSISQLKSSTEVSEYQVSKKLFLTFVEGCCKAL